MSDIMQEILNDLAYNMDRIERVAAWQRKNEGTRPNETLARLEHDLVKAKFLFEAFLVYRYLVPGTSPEQLNAVFVSADGLRMLDWVDPDSSAREVVRPIRRERRMTCAEFYGDKLPELEPFRCRKYRFDGQYERSPFGKLAIFREVES